MCSTHQLSGPSLLYDHPILGQATSSLVIFAGGQDRCSTGSDSVSFPCTTLSLCLNPDLKGPPLKAYTIQGQYAIPQPDLTKLHQLAIQQSHFLMMHGNTRFSGIESSSLEVKSYWSLDASAQTTSHELTIPNDVSIVSWVALDETMRIGFKEWKS